VGTPIIAEAINGFISYLRRPSQTLVFTLRNAHSVSREFYHTFRKSWKRPTSEQTYTTSPPLELEDSRTYSSFDFAGLEYGLAQSHYYVKH
jgi:hypothetical protein